ncbi:MAG: hypothetical protein J7L55_01575 [Desulfurococcales archaeon]|nr:hypothetical protein [Desulfurococcales archaeon]
MRKALVVALAVALAASGALSAYFWMRLSVVSDELMVCESALRNLKTSSTQTINHLKDRLRNAEKTLSFLNTSLSSCIRDRENLSGEVDALKSRLEACVKSYASNLTACTYRASSLNKSLNEIINATNALTARTSLTKVSPELRRSFMRVARAEGPRVMKVAGLRSVTPLTIFEWVEMNLYYQEDPDIPVPTASGVFISHNLWKLPNETITDQGGDCEDLSLLIYEFLRASGVRAWILIASGGSEEHAVVITKYGKTWFLIDPAGDWVNGYGLFLTLKSGGSKGLLIPPLTVMPSVKSNLIGRGAANIVWFNYLEGTWSSSLSLKSIPNTSLSSLIQAWVSFWDGKFISYAILNDTTLIKLRSIHQLTELLNAHPTYSTPAEFPGRVKCRHNLS